jgi:FMN-dependent NADH-azoreductase
MSNLLHIDSSIQGDQSVSREITAAFADAWKLANPAGGYVYRDLGADPLPHIDATYYLAVQTPAEQRTEVQHEAWQAAKPVIDEVLAADVILLGSPMYNFSIPSALKAWIDRIAVRPFFVDQETGVGALTGKRVVVATSRGGSYAPGTPRESFDFQEPYLRAVFSMIGLDQDLSFVHTELTLAHVVPEMAQLRDLAVSSKELAHETVRKLAAA